MSDAKLPAEGVQVGDTVFVHALHRNSGDAQPRYGECVVVAVQPRHVYGPCLMVRDEHGETTVYERYTIPLGMARRSAEIDT